MYRKTRIIGIILAGMLPVTALAAKTTVYDIKYSYDTVAKTAAVIKQDKSVISGDVTIPNSIIVNSTEYTVTTIAIEEFQNCTSSTKVTFADGSQLICEIY